MNKLSLWFYKIAHGWVVITSLIVFLIFSAFVLPNQASQAEAYSGGIGSPDTSFFYTAKDLYTFAEAYGSDGRAEYIRARFTFDVIWPVVYMVFLTVTISWMITKVNLEGNTWRRINLIPVLGLFFDFLENFSTALVMARYPAKTVVVDWLAGIFTSIKWIFVAGSFVILVGGAVFLLWQSFQQKKAGSQT